MEQIGARSVWGAFTSSRTILAVAVTFAMAVFSLHLPLETKGSENRWVSATWIGHRNLYVIGVNFDQILIRPQGYTYSVFNLVYETNTASCRIWDSLGFKRIGRVPGCGNLKSFEEPVDAIIYGRDLNAADENLATEERFDKIRYYLRHSLYPQGANRSEKSRLRSAAIHYKLVGGKDGEPEKLMLKDKEVISDPDIQYQIAKQVHLQSHGGINKTTASIATKYHWVRIKETVSHVIKNCPECKDSNKAPVIRADNLPQSRSKGIENQDQATDSHTSPATGLAQISLDEARLDEYEQAAQLMQPSVADPNTHLADYEDMAIDPQIMEQLQAQLASEYQQHHDSFGPAGLSAFGHPEHLGHNDPSVDGFGDQHTDQFMEDQTTGVLDANQGLGNNSRDQDLDLRQHIIQNNFIHRGGGPRYSS